MFWEEYMTKLLRITVIFAVGFASVSSLAQSDAQKALDRFKSLVGTWTGKSAQGQPSDVTYRLMAGGTSVMAESVMGDEAMTSLFYVDGDRLLMTHFCPSNNQPRMKATISPDGEDGFLRFSGRNQPGLAAGRAYAPRGVRVHRSRTLQRRLDLETRR